MQPTSAHTDLELLKYTSSLLNVTLLLLHLCKLKGQVSPLHFNIDLHRQQQQHNAVTTPTSAACLLLETTTFIHITSVIISVITSVKQ